MCTLMENKAHRQSDMWSWSNEGTNGPVDHVPFHLSYIPDLSVRVARTNRQRFWFALHMQVVAHTIHNQNMKHNNCSGVRKGAWTSDEDVLLRKCIDKFGERDWHKVPTRAGLNRCRKSCRLRWLNYLKPGIKRNQFEEDEVDLLLRLHKLLGNRWSLIAARLPGRTANDIKNFWNTHIKKKMTPKESKKEDNMTNHITKPESMVKVKAIRPHPQTISKNLLCRLRRTYNIEVTNDNGATTSKNLSEGDSKKETSNNSDKELIEQYCSDGVDENKAIPSTFECISLDAELLSSCFAMDFTYGDAQWLTKDNPTDDGANDYWNDLPSYDDIWESLAFVGEETHFREGSFLSCME